MPIVMIQIDATNTTGPGVASAITSLDSVSKALTKLADAGVAAKAGITDIGAKAASEAPGVTTLADAAKGLNSALRGTNNAVGQWDAAMQKLGSGSAAGGKGFDAIVAGSIKVNDALTVTMGVMDAFMLKMGEVDGAAVALGRTLGTVRGVGSLGGGGAGAGGGYFGTSMIGAGGASIYGNGAMQMNAGPFGGRLGSNVLGGLGMAGSVGLLGGVAAIAIGVKATKDASQFWSALAQSAAQSGTFQNANGTPDMAGLRKFGQGIIDYTAAGKSPFSGTTLAQGAEIPLASGYSKDAIQQALPHIAMLAAQNRAKDLTSADQLVTSLANAAGTGTASTGAQLIGYADFAAKAEQMTKASPGAITTAMPTVLGALPGSGVSMSDATALLLKMGTVDPRMQRDAQAIRQLIQATQVKPTAGSIKAASGMGLAIGAGSADLYGGIFGWLQALHTAANGDEHKVASVLTQKNALQAYNDIYSGGGMNQTIGYANRLNSAAGTGQNAFDQLSKGTAQQTTQLMNAFNSDLVSLGTTLTDNVVPHLLDFGKALHEGIQAALNWGKQTPSNPSAATPLDVLGLALTGSNPFTGDAQNRAARGQRMQNGAIPFFGGVGALDNWAQTMPLGTNNQMALLSQLGSWLGIGGGSNGPATAHPQASVGTHLEWTGHGPLRRQIVVPNSPASGMSNAATNPYQQYRYATPAEMAATPSGGSTAGVGGGLLTYDPYGDARYRYGAGAPAARAVSGGFAPHDYMSHTSQETTLGAYLAYMAKQRATAVDPNQAVRDDRGALSNLEKSGTATSAQLHQALAKLTAALDHSTYSAGQKANILGKETANVTTYDRNLQAQGFQDMANAAQDNLTAAQQMGKTPQALKAIFDQFIAAERSVIMLTTKPGLARDKLLGALGQQQQVGDYGYDVGTANRGLKDRQDQAAIDKLNGNMGAYTADLKAIYAFQSANAQKFGMNGKDLALAFATMQHDIGAGQPRSNIHPFFQANQGVGGLMAGINSTAVRVGGSVDPATSAIRELMRENARLQHENTNLLQEIANNTRRPGSAANPPTSTYGQRSAHA